jgi:hypothetical protein
MGKSEVSHTNKYRYWVERFKMGLSATFYCSCHRILDATPTTPNEVRCFCGRLMLLCDYNDIPWDGYQEGSIGLFEGKIGLSIRRETDVT